MCLVFVKSLNVADISRSVEKEKVYEIVRALMLLLTTEIVRGEDYSQNWVVKVTCRFLAMIRKSPKE